MWNVILFITCALFKGSVSVKDRYYRDLIIAVNDPHTVHEELGEYFEGDMVLTDEQKEWLYLSRSGKNGLIDVTKRWPNNTLVYVIQEDEFDENQKTLIKDAMADIENNSCITFRNRTNNEYAVRISGARSGCFSSVGYVYNENAPLDEQVLNLARGCFRHGTIVHEMLHALGFYHMQSTYNRDDFVQIVWRNIQRGKEHNFYKYDNRTVTDFGVPYDYGSVLHYGAYSFSRNGRRTIVPLEDGVTIGQRVGMSNSDIEKLNRMYNCDTGDVVDNK